MVTMTWLAAGAAAISGSVLVIGILLFELPGRVSEHRADLYGASMTAAVAALGSLAMWRLGPRATAVHRRTWRLCAIGLASWSSGSLVIVASRAGLLPESFALIGELAFLSSVVIMAAAVLVHPLLGPTPERLRVLVDASIIAASAAMIVWLTAARPYHRMTGDLETAVVGLAYPTIETAVALSCLWIVVRSPRTTSDQAVAMQLAMAFGLFALGDTLALALRSFTGDRLPMLAETPFVIGICLCVLAARSSARDRTTSVWSVDQRRLADGLSVAPAMAAVIAGASLLVDGVVHGRLDTAAVLLLTVIISMVLARQSLTLRDNQHLSTSLRATVERLERQATHDRLTGLPNRSGLTDRIAEALVTATERGRFAALCFVDVDHLKSVNDSLGHPAGDQLLVVLARRLGEVPGAEVTRVGGDEFVVIAHGLGSRDEAQRLGEDLLTRAGRPTDVAGISLRPSVSIGIAVGDPGVVAADLLRRADIALYRAKAHGRRRVASYDPALDGESLRRLDLEPELRRALDRDEFEVHYQPVIELATSRLVKVEALLRWRHPTRGLLTPDKFLAEAASSGLLGAIGERTLMTACRDFAPRPDRPPLTVAVNLSTTELTDRRVVERVRNATRTHEVDTHRLVIEITEDVVVDDTIRRTIDELCALGVKLAIDDFGTGNSSLRQLGAYPADTLKIDKSFIDRIDTDLEAVTVTRALLGLARNLGLRTVAEGVETEAQAQLLRGLGCDCAQGWLYAPALPYDELEARFLTGSDLTIRPAGV